MNMNEVLASIANEKLTGKKGGKVAGASNDHVNMGQSSNDSFPTTNAYCNSYYYPYEKLVPALNRLHQSLDAKKQKHGVK